MLIDIVDILVVLAILALLALILAPILYFVMRERYKDDSDKESES